MPILKSAKKRVKTAARRTEQKRGYKTRMLTMIKNIINFVKGGEVEKAKAIFNDAQSAIDTAAKKNIIHPNNAARKKARIARAISDQAAA